MSSWPLVNLKDLLKEVTVGHVGSMIEEYVEDGVPFFRSKNIKPFRVDWKDIRYISKEFNTKIKKSQLSPGDVVTVRTGNPGISCVIPKTIQLANCSDLVIFRVDTSKLDPDFLAYFMNSTATSQVKSRLVGAVQQHFNVGSAKELLIPYPPIKKQKKIVNLLNNISNKIRILSEMNQTLEKMAQAIFKHWFVDFEFPNKQGKPYKSSGGKMVASELGKIPKGWAVATIRDEFNVTMGQSPPGSSYNEDLVGSVFFQGRTDFGVRFPTNRLYTTNPKRFAKIGDVLMSVRAPVGDINIALEDCCIGRGLASIRGDNPTYCLYKMKSLKSSLDVFESQGTVFGSINKDGLEGLEVIQPQNNVIDSFESRCSSFDSKILCNTLQIKTLEKTRDLLLPKLISGEIKIKSELKHVGKNH